MGKKKKTQVFVLRPWCWYCEREFEDEKVLLQHQKSKHFKCQMCPRKLNTAGGLMVHSQQVHKCEPEPLTNTMPGRDGYDIEIFGMEGVPTNALAEWKARKESEAGSAALAAAAAGKRPRHSYNVIPEADLQAALAQHKVLMAARDHPAPAMPFPPFLPGGAPPFPPGMAQPGFPPGFPAGFPMPPPTLSAGAPPPGFPALPPTFRPPFPPGAIPPFLPPSNSPLIGIGSPAQGGTTSPSPYPAAVRPPPSFVPQSGAMVASSDPSPGKELAVDGGSSVQPPKDGVIWPDVSATPAEKRAQQPRYRYISTSTDGVIEMEGADGLTGRKRKAAADFL